MKYRLNILHNEIYYSYNLLSNTNFQLIHIENCIHLIIVKHHNHKYEIAGFFYRTKYLLYPRIYSTKKELYGAIQELLQKHL